MRRVLGIGMAVAISAGALAIPATAQESVTLNVATINNPDMILMSELAQEFTEETGINVEFAVLPDQELRQQVTQDVALARAPTTS